MRFWDASALVPLCLAQPASATVRSLLPNDPALIVWWASPMECWSAFARLKREGVLTGTQEKAVLHRLELLRNAWAEVLPGEAVRSHAARLLRLHPLRAADALQLAAALVWAGTPHDGASFVTLDERLGQAAQLEGFEVLP